MVILDVNRKDEQIEVHLIFHLFQNCCEIDLDLTIINYIEDLYF